MKKDIRFIHFMHFNDGRRGYLDVADSSLIPFTPKRMFLITNVSRDQTRGGHAHKKCHQLLVAINGMVIVRSGANVYMLKNIGSGLYVPPMNVIRMEFTSEETYLLVLASHDYNESDYIDVSDKVS